MVSACLVAWHPLDQMWVACVLLIKAGEDLLLVIFRPQQRDSEADIEIACRRGVIALVHTRLPVRVSQATYKAVAAGGACHSGRAFSCR